MDQLETILAIEEIKSLMARRCRALDAHDWDGYRACHTVDCVSLALRGETDPVRGRENMVATLRGLVEDKLTVHHVHTPEIRVLTDSTAEGTWAMEDMLWWEEDGRPAWLHGYGRYFDTYAKVDGTWYFSSRRLDRFRVDTGFGREGDPAWHGQTGPGAGLH